MDGDKSRALSDAVASANELIFQSANDEDDHLGMGTTLVCMLVDGARAWIAHVGDSRAYRLRGETLELLTRITP